MPVGSTSFSPGGSDDFTVGAPRRKRRVDDQSVIGPFRGHETARRTELLYRYLPRRSMSVNDMFVAASDPNTSDEEMFKALNRTRRIAGAKKYSDNANRALTGYDGDRSAHRLQMQWEKLSRQERRYLKSIGMEEPLVRRAAVRDAQDGEDEGFLGSITPDFVEDAAGFGVGVAKTIGGAALKGAMPILQVAGEPLKKVTQAWRAESLLWTRGLNLAIYGGTGREDADYLNEQDGKGLWAEIEAAWEDAGANGGEGTFQDATRREAFKAAGEDATAYRLAYYRASGMDDVTAAQRAAIAELDVEDDEAEQHPEWIPTFNRIYDALGSRKTRRAQRVFDEGHMSPGREVTRVLGIQEGTRDDTLFNVLSGSIDAAWSIGLDPVMHGGGKYKAYRQAQRAANTKEYALGLTKKITGGTGKAAEENANKLMVASGRDMNHPEYVTDLAKIKSPEERLLIAATDLLKDETLDTRKLAKFQTHIVPREQTRFTSFLLAADKRVRLFPSHLSDETLEGVVAKTDEAIAANDDRVTQAMGIQFGPAKPVLDADGNVVKLSLWDQQLEMTKEASERAVAANADALAGTKGIRTVDDMLKVIDSAGGRAAMAEGLWDSKRFKGMQMPAITQANLIRNRAWARTARKVDDWRFAVDRQAEMLEHMELDELDNLRFGGKEPFLKQAKQVRAAAADLAFRLSTPSSNGILSVMGPDSLREFEAALKMGMNRDELWETWARFAASPSAAARRKVATNAMDSMMQNLGIDKLDPDMYAAWMRQNGTRFQSYSLAEDLDLMGFGDEAEKAAIFLGQHADDTIVMPSFRVMREASARSFVLKNWEGAVNSNMVSRFMERAWKPLMILRVGFIPRVAVDEVLPWMAREGAGSPLNAWFVQPWHRFTAEDQVPALLKPFASAERKLLHWNYMDAYEREVEDLVRIATTLDERGAVEAAELTGTFSKRGMERFKGAMEQYRASGGINAVETDTGEIVRALTRGNRYVDTKWASRYAGYNASEIKVAKWMQGKLKAATDGLITESDKLAFEALTHDPLLIAPHLNDITTGKGAAFYEPVNVTSALDQVGARVKVGDRFVVIKMRPEQTRFGITNRAEGEAFRMNIEHQLHTFATTPEGRGGGAVANGLLHQPTAVAIGKNLGYGDDLEEVIFRIDQVRDAYTGLSQGTRETLLNAWTHPRADVRRTLQQDLLDDKLFPEELKVVLRNMEPMDNKQIATLFFDKRQLYIDVEDVNASQQISQAERLRKEGEEAIDTGTELSRDDFRQEYATATTALRRSKLPEDSDLYLPLPAQEQLALEARIRELEGRDIGVWDHAGQAEVATETASARLAEAAEERSAAVLASAENMPISPLDNDIQATLYSIANGGTPPEGLTDEALDEWWEHSGSTLSSDPAVIMEQSRQVDALIDRAAKEIPDQVPVQLALMDVSNDLRSHYDALRRYDKPTFRPMHGDPEFADVLFNAHRELRTALVAPRTFMRPRAVDDPIAGAARLARDEDYALMLHGDVEATERVVNSVIGHHIVDPRNAEAQGSMRRSIEDRAGRRVAPGSVDGHTQTWAPMMSEQDLHRAMTKILNGPVDETSTGAVHGFLALRGDDFDVDAWLARTPSEDLTLKPIGTWATTDPEKARAISKRLYDAAGVDDLPDGYTGMVNVPNKLATAYSPRHLPDTEMTLPHGYDSELERMRPWNDSEMITPEDALRDQRTVATRNVMTWIKDGEPNSVALHGIGTGRPSPFHTMETDTNLLPDTITGPNRAIDTRDLSWYNRAIQWGFEKGIGQWIDGMVRVPLFTRQLGTKLKEARDLLRPVMIDDETIGRGLLPLKTHGVGDSEDLFREIRSMYGNVKGYYAVPDADVTDPILRYAVRGAEAPLDLRTLKWMDKNGHLKGRLKSYLDSVDTRIQAAQRHAIETGIDPKMAKQAIRDKVDAELSDIADLYAMEKRFSSHVTESASRRALNETLPYVDDHRVRSQFSEIGRNVLPFFWAQEQTARRWAASVAQNPAFIREVQLGMHGARSMGLVRKDQYGNDQFVYPGSTSLQELVGRIPVFGDHAKVAVTIPLTGRVAYTVPALQDMGVPSFSPVITVPVRLAAEINPELEGLRDTVLIGGYADSPWYSDLMPGVVTRALHTIGANADGDRDYAAAQLQVIQSMEVANLELTEKVEEAEARVQTLQTQGASAEEVRAAQERLTAAVKERNQNGVPDSSADDGEVEDFMRRVGEQTKVMLATKMVLGFLGPVSPQADLHNAMSEEYQQLLKVLPVDEALATFIKANPHASPWTVFQSESPSGAPVQSTPAVDAWLDESGELIDNFPMAAPWLAPDTDEKYSSKAYANALASGVRRRQGPMEMYREIKTKEAAPIYFDMRDDYALAIASAPDKETRDALDDEWAEWRDQYLSVHRTFASELRSPDASKRREDVITQMREMVNDPRTPDQPEVDIIRELVQSHAVFQAKYDEHAGDTSGEAQRIKLDLRKRFLDWGDMFVHENPRLSALWRGVYRQNVDPKDLTLDTIRAKRQGILYDTDPHDAPTPMRWAMAGSN